MKKLDFYIPTKIIYGKGRIKEFGEVLDKKFKNIMIVSGKSSYKKSGAYEKISTQLKDRNIILFNEVKENPDFETLMKGAELAKNEKVELIIGIGGGSPMDAAKGIALLATNGGNMRDYMKGKETKKAPLPIVCIPTTSGTGSEVTPYAVFTDSETKDKGGYANPSIYPIFSIIDPELTYSMPDDVLINTGLDALTHALEAYLSTKATPLNDVISIHAIEIIMGNLKDSLKRDKEAMDRLSYASMIAGIAIANAGTLLLHAAGYPLTVYHQIPHGKANAILLPAFMKFMKEKSEVKAKVELLEGIFEEYGGIQEFINYFGISTKLSKNGISEAEINTFVEKTIVKKNLKITPAQISREDLFKFYKDTF